MDDALAIGLGVEPCDLLPYFAIVQEAERLAIGLHGHTSPFDDPPSARTGWW
jgi:hypothetical protein